MESATRRNILVSKPPTSPRVESTRSMRPSVSPRGSAASVEEEDEEADVAEEEEVVGVVEGEEDEEEEDEDEDEEEEEEEEEVDVTVADGRNVEDDVEDNAKDEDEEFASSSPSLNSAWPRMLARYSLNITTVLCSLFWRACSSAHARRSDATSSCSREASKRCREMRS